MTQPDRNHQPRLPLLLLLAGSVCISFSPVFIKLAAMPPDSVGVYRMLFAGLSLYPLMLFRGENLRMPKAARYFLGLAGVVLAIDFMCWHRSIALVGPGLSTLLGNFQVFFTALFSWLFLRQKISRLFAVAVLLALCGLYLITGHDGGAVAGHYKFGVCLGLLTAVFYSGYILLVKGALNDNAVQGVPAMLVVAIPSTLLLAVVAPLNGESLAIPSPASLWALLGVSVLSTTIGWSLISSAIKQIQATVAGLILLLQPALALVWDTLFFGRPTGALEVLGILLILVAIFIGSLRPS